jgi:hypothetical protein
MLKLLRELGSALNLRRAAEGAAIAQVQSQLGWVFPDEYIAFLRTSNGCDGNLANGDYVYLWSVEELLVANASYGFPEFCPEIVAFGTNGGGEAFGFKRTNGHIAMVDLCALDIKDAIDIAPRFTEFLCRARPADWA